MKYLGKNHIVAILFGLFIVVPFFILEWFTTSGFVRSGFPLVLFILMSVNGVLFAGVLLSILKDVQGGVLESQIAWFALKVITLLLLGWAWVHVVIDQMPCFLGGSGC